MGANLILENVVKFVVSAVDDDEETYNDGEQQQARMVVVRGQTNLVSALRRSLGQVIM